MSPGGRFRSGLSKDVVSKMRRCVDCGESFTTKPGKRGGRRCRQCRTARSSKYPTTSRNWLNRQLHWLAKADAGEISPIDYFPEPLEPDGPLGAADGFVPPPPPRRQPVTCCMRCLVTIRYGRSLCRRCSNERVQKLRKKMDAQADRIRQELKDPRYQDDWDPAAEEIRRQALAAEQEVLAEQREYERQREIELELAEFRQRQAEKAQRAAERRERTLAAAKARQEARKAKKAKGKLSVRVSRQAQKWKEFLAERERQRQARRQGTG